MKVLICTVGGSPEPIINAIRQNNPDFTYFLCSGGDNKAASSQTIQNETRFVTKGECPYCNKKYENTHKTPPIVKRADLQSDQYAIESVYNPDQLPDILCACEKIKSSINTRFGEHVQVIANYTGGTKTMSLGLGIFALRSSGWELQVNAPAFDGRRDLIKVTTGDVALVQDVKKIIIEDVLKSASELESRCEYGAAIDLLHFVMTTLVISTEDRQPLFERLQQNRMMAAWDRFDHQEALEIVESNIKRLGQHRKKLRLLVRAKECFTHSSQWNPKDVSGLELVEDLIKNAQRCVIKKRYDDAAGRLYRATELLAQIRLNREYHIHSGDVDISNDKIDDISRQWLCSMRNERNQKIQLGLFASYRLLNDLNDPLGAYFEKNKNPLHHFIDARNQSLYAHGLQPIGLDEWNNVGKNWQMWLKDALMTLKFSIEDVS